MTYPSKKMTTAELLELNKKSLTELNAVGAKASDIKFLGAVTFFNRLRGEGYAYDYCVARTIGEHHISESQLARKVKLFKMTITL